MIYVLFGEMGIGKNYVGERLATHLGCEFFDGDLVVPKAMVEKVMNFKPLSVKDINEYVDGFLIPAIKEKARAGDNLVVAQALYMGMHRSSIQFALGRKNVKLVFLPVPSLFTHMRRLYSRKNGLKWALYGLFNKAFFQKPHPGTYIIDNETGGDLDSQIEELVLIVKQAKRPENYWA